MLSITGLVLMLALTLSAVLGVAILVSEKSERAWACGVALMFWFFLQFSFAVIGVWTESAGWSLR